MGHLYHGYVSHNQRVSSGILQKVTYHRLTKFRDFPNKNKPRNADLR